MSLIQHIKKLLFQNKDLIGGSSQLIVLRLVAMGISYLFTFLTARFYGADVVGLFAMTNVVLLVSTLLSRGGMDILFLRQVSALINTEKKSEIRSLYSQIISNQLLIGALVSFGLFISAPWLAETVFDTPQLTNIFRLASFAVLPTAWNTIHSEGFRAKKELFNYIFFTRGWHFLLSIIGITLLWYLNQNSPIYYFVAYFIAVIITALAGAILWNRDTTTRLKTFTVKGFTAVYKESFPMLLSSSMFLVMSWTDTFMLGIYEDAEVVGSYHVAVKISNLMTIVLFGINGISAPKLSSTYSLGDRSGFKQTVTSSATLSFSLSLPILIIIGFFNTDLLRLFSEEVIMAGTALTVLAIGQFINGSCGSVMSILQMTKNQVIGQNILLSAGAINVLLNYLLIPRYGIEGAAVSTAISTAYWNLASVIAVRVKLKVWSIPFSYKFIGGIRTLIKR